MPQIMRYPWDNLTITLSGTAGTVTALIYQPGSKRTTLYWEDTAGTGAVAGRLSFDEDDQATMSAFDMPMSVLTYHELDLPRNGMSGQTRRWTEVTLATNPTDGTLYRLNVAGTEVIFEFESAGGVGAGNTSVTIGVNAAATATNLAAAISASALSAESDRDLRNTSKVNIITKTDVSMSHVTDTTSELTLGEIRQDGTVLYLAATTNSNVVNVLSEGA